MRAKASAGITGRSRGIALTALAAAALLAGMLLAPPPSAAAHERASAATLRLGSRGAAVRALQAALVRLAYLPPGAADGVFGSRTWHALVAFQGWQRLSRDGIAGPATRRALAKAAVPRPWSTLPGIEVHIPQQVLLLVAGGRVVRAIHVSTGMPGWPTPLGHFRIRERYERSWSVPFSSWMPLAQYFTAGYAIHEYPEVPSHPASHGCVRLPAGEAGVVWSFGRIGMRLWTVA